MYTQGEQLPVGEEQLASLQDSEECPLPKELVPILKLVFFPCNSFAALPAHARAGCSQTTQSLSSSKLNREASEGPRSSSHDRKKQPFA